MRKLIIIILTALVFTSCDILGIKNNPSKPIITQPIINPGDTPDNPITRIENCQLTTVAWVTLLNEIKANGKYVDLDLSACTSGGQSSGGGLWSDGTFYPDPYLQGINSWTAHEGKTKIVSLILPEAATSFPKPRETEDTTGILYEVMFSGFSALRHISGINITDIVRNCFAGLGTLYSPDDGHVIWNTGILTSIDFPNVITIGEDAFIRCYNLTYVNIPKVQIIKMQAFGSCLSLQSLFIPDIIFISYVAFNNTILTEFVLGEVAPKMDYRILGDASSRTITVKVPQEATGYGEIPNNYIGGDTSKNWGNAFRGMGWNPDRANMLYVAPNGVSSGVRYDADGFAPINYIRTGITLRVEYIP